MATKRINLYAWLPALLLLLAGCSNELEITIPGDPVPVVFCVVNPEDGFCYVTVSKTFSAESNALDILKNGSQLKVDDAKITLEAWGSGYKLWETGFSLIEDTLPANALQSCARSCYKSDKELLFQDLCLYHNSGKSNYKELRLQISSPQFKNIAYSRVPILRGPLKVSPLKRMALDLYRKINTDFKCKLDRNQVRYISVVCDFYYREKTDQWADKCAHIIAKNSVAWQQIDPVRDTVNIRMHENFLNQIAAAIPDDPDVIVRSFRYMDFKIIVGDEYINDYCDTYINAASQDMAVYTNMINGYGIFSVARSIEYPSITFDGQSLDSLLFGRFTRDLHFADW
ncbi:MAG: hypothetical protein PHY99_01475 [Bacteroidales bacterium]|nr:hypothetical protein [Bacteroidales bacterium]